MYKKAWKQDRAMYTQGIGKKNQYGHILKCKEAYSEK